MPEKVKREMCGRGATTKKLRKTDDVEGLLFSRSNPLTEMKGLSKGVFKDPIEYQKKLRQEWETNENSP